MKNTGQYIKQWFTPNAIPNKNSRIWIISIWIAFTMIVWMASSEKLAPRPSEIWSAFISLVQNNDFIRELFSSTALCFKALFYSVVISLLIAYSWTIPFFRPMVNFVGKMRFLTTVGLTFLFAQIFPDTASEKMALMIFSICVFLVTSASSIVSSVTKEELDYVKTMKRNNWEVMTEVIIIGKFDQMLEIIRQNFAIAWMMLVCVENLCRADGGIGIMLTDQNKHFHIDAVYAIQICVLFVGMGIDLLLDLIRRLFCPYAYITVNTSQKSTAPTLKRRGL